MNTPTKPCPHFHTLIRRALEVLHADEATLMHDDALGALADLVTSAMVPGWEHEAHDPDLRLPASPAQRREAATLARRLDALCARLWARQQRVEDDAACAAAELFERLGADVA